MADDTTDAVVESMDEVEGIDEQELADVKALWKEYDEAYKFDEPARKNYVLHRAYASGNKLKNWASDANLIGTFIDILVSFLYAKDPDVSSRGARQVGGVSKDNRLFAETANIIIPHLWKRGRLKRAARKQVRSALSVGPGWLKVIMTHETAIDPIVQKELNDLQDNLERLQFTAQQLEENADDLDRTNELIAEQERLRESLQSRLEVVRHQGLAIDFVLADDMQVSLDVGCVSDYLDADWMGNQMFIRADDLRRRFPRITEDAGKKATLYHQRRTQPDESESDVKREQGHIYTKATSQSSKDEVGFVRVVEIWDHRDNHIKTMVEGCKMWARVPYQPQYGTSRFYPYFGYFPFETDGERHPQSLSGRLDKLQDEYSSKRSNSRLNAERSVPGTLFDKTALDDADVKRIEGSVHQEFIGIKHTKGDDLRKAFAAKPVPSVDPMVFDTRSTVADMERVAGIQEALSQGINTAKTATEAKIQQTGFASRTSADRDEHEDMLTDLATYTLELAVQAVPPEEAARIAGDEAFWPFGMSVEDVITMAEVDLRAGSTGKPNEEAERQSWSILLPLIQSVMMEIQRNQLMGNMPMVEALTNLLKETFRRLDERIDVDQFLPEAMPNLAGVADPLAGMGENPEPGAGDPGQTSADANTLV